MKTPQITIKPKTSKAKLRIIHNAKEVGVIAGGSLIGAASYDGISRGVEKIRKKNTESPRELNWKTRAGWVGTIAAGDVVGEGVHDALKPKKKKHSRVQSTTAIPGNGPTSLARLPLLTQFIMGPDAYSIKRRNLRGKKPIGVPKVKGFKDQRRTTDLNPDKTEKFKNIATGVGALGGAAATGYAAHRVGKAAAIAEKLQKHIGGHITHTADKVNAHIDYIGHHAGEAASEATRTAKTARKTAAGYHPRAIAKMVGGKLKRIPLLNRFIAGSATTEFKEKHPKGEERHPSWIQKNGVRIAGTAAGIAGTALFFKHFKPPMSGPDVTRGRGITKSIVKKPGERKVAKAEPSKISEIQRVPKRKKSNLEAGRSGIVRFSTPIGRDSDGKFPPKAELIPSYHKAKKIVTVGRRGGDVAQDIHDIVKGKPKDPKKKRFYEKAWFQGGALALAGGVGIRAHRKHAEKHDYHPYFSSRHPVTNLSAFMRDVAIHKLAESTQKDIAQVLPLKKGTKVAHYGMVPKELLSKADPHNMATARKHVASLSPLRARRDVDGKPDKHILLLNDRIVDGHHHLAKAEKGGISRSLPVLDLTPARFQLSAVRARVIDLAFLIHDDSFPLIPTKAPKLPKGMKQRVPTAETKEQVIARLKAQTQLSRSFSSGGLGKLAAETIIDSTTIGADIGPKKKKSKAKKAADDADPDLSPTNNWTADPQAPLVKMAYRNLATNFGRLPMGVPPTRPTPRGYAEGSGPKTDDHKGLSTKNHGFDKFTRALSYPWAETRSRRVQQLLDSYEFSRSSSQLMKLRHVPLRMKKTGSGQEIRVAPTKKSVPDAARREDIAYYTDDIKDARATAAAMVRNHRRTKGAHFQARIPLIEFYGTSAGVTSSWDTRGRTRDKAANGAHWWTHSPTRNSVRVVRSQSESGPRTRRSKKFHEKTSTHKAAIAIASGAAAGLGVLAANRHLKFRKLDKLVHKSGHTVSVINRKGQSPLYSQQKHAKPGVQTSSTVPRKESKPASKR